MISWQGWLGRLSAPNERGKRKVRGGKAAVYRMLCARCGDGWASVMPLQNEKKFAKLEKTCKIDQGTRSEPSTHMFAMR